MARVWGLDSELGSPTATERTAAAAARLLLLGLLVAGARVARARVTALAANVLGLVLAVSHGKGGWSGKDESVFVQSGW